MSVRIKRQDHPQSCGPATLSLLLSRFGIKRSEQELVAEYPEELTIVTTGDKKGVLALNLGVVGSKVGFKTHCLTFNSDNKLVKEYNNLATAVSLKFHKEKPSQGLIDRVIDSSKAAIVTIDVDMFYKGEDTDSKKNHFLLITPGDNESYNCYDTLKAAQYKVSKEKILVAIQKAAPNASCYLIYLEN